MSKTPELLDVLVQQLAGRGLLVALRGHRILPCRQTCSASDLAGSRHGALRQAQTLGQCIRRSSAGATQRHGALDRGGVEVQRAAQWPEAAIKQPGGALERMTALPLAWLEPDALKKRESDALDLWVSLKHSCGCFIREFLKKDGRRENLRLPSPRVNHLLGNYC
ncbi:hypothetical protein J7E49_06450 [Variovorax paradoxus]|nr:hypothetical protein [Variovorax paradoxus]